VATFDFVIDETFVGQAIGPANGFLVSLAVTAVPKVYETPNWDAGRLCWKTAYLQLRGSGDSQNIFFCANPHQWGFVSKFLVSNQSLSYRGDLQIICVPRGAVFELTLSDIPYDRTLLRTPANLAEAGQALVAQILKEQAALAERELVRR
jgi:hypothetical protein